MDFPNRFRPYLESARFIVFVCLILLCAGASVNAGTSLVIFGANGTNVPPQATNIALVNSDTYYSVVRNDGSAVVFNPSSQPQYAQVWTTNPPFLSVLALEDVTLALLSNHIVYDYPYYQLPKLTNVLAIWHGYSYNYALNENGTLYSFGYPSGDDSFHDDPIASTFSNIVFLSSSTSATESVALKNDGTVIQWNTTIGNFPNPPVDLTNVVGIATGYGWCLALRNNGTVSYWGGGEYVTNVPPGLSNVVAIASLGESAVALKCDGTMTLGDMCHRM